MSARIEVAAASSIYQWEQLYNLFISSDSAMTLRLYIIRVISRLKNGFCVPSVLAIQMSADRLVLGVVIVNAMHWVANGFGNRVLVCLQPNYSNLIQFCFYLWINFKYFEFSEIHSKLVLLLKRVSVNLIGYKWVRTSDWVSESQH